LISITKITNTTQYAPLKYHYFSKFCLISTTNPLNKRTAKPCRYIMPHSVAPINAAVCNKARSPLGDRQCAEPTRTTTRYVLEVRGVRVVRGKILHLNYHSRGIKSSGISIFMVSPDCSITYSPASRTAFFTSSSYIAPAIAPCTFR